jgi:EAL domain-containing protein (putative c-di-GMP-specific phosphodiesterase class I)
VVGVEALIRWKHLSKGMISPVEFIPYVEKMGLMPELERWIIRAVFKQVKDWEMSGLKLSMVSLNLSSKGLLCGGLFEYLMEEAEQHNILAKNIQLEITETAVLKHIDKAITVLEQISDLGYSIALDDFGTGYSSLNYLRKLPVNVLKLDREFIQNISTCFKDHFILTWIISMAGALGVKTIAEGVETLEQGLALKALGCDMIQGYYYGKPINASELIEWKLSYDRLLQVKVSTDVI